MDLARLAGLLVAQVDPSADPSATAAGGPISDAGSVPVIALRRWFGSLTLSSPEALPTRFAFWAWVVGVSALLFLAVLAQGPRRALGQALNVPGFVRLIGAALARLRRSGRAVAILLGATVISWTAWQTPLHNRTEKKEELALLLKSKSRAEFASEQGAAAALTPLRDVLGLGDALVLLVGAAALVFKFSADRWGRSDGSRDGDGGGGLTTLCWAGAGVYAIYRLASLIVDAEGLPPLGGCLFVEVGVIPLLMLLADGLILAWLLVELRGGEGSDEEAGFDVSGTIRLMPAACLACLAGLPARYAASAVGLAFFYHLPAKVTADPWVLELLRGRGLIGLQAGSLALVGIAGAAAWSRGTWGSALATYGRMLKADGGHLAALVALVGLGAGSAAGLAYFAVLALPTQPWVLLAADGYAHYATLPFGLVGLSAMVELAARVAPPPEAKVPDVLFVDDRSSPELDSR